MELLMDDLKHEVDCHLVSAAALQFACKRKKTVKPHRMAILQGEN
jgi:hypothetical protein